MRQLIISASRLSFSLAIEPSSLDEIDDLLSELHARTTNAQFVVTSQVSLLRANFERKLVLPGLNAEVSKRVIRGPLEADQALHDIDSESALLAFAEGHPLTLRLVGALVSYFGTGKALLDRIRARGVGAIEVPRRRKQTHETSLGVCLSLAYEAISAEERALLYVIASCPAGCFTSYFELRGYSAVESSEIIAALRHWSLVRVEDPGQPYERVSSLSPIRAYAQERWLRENPERAQVLTHAVLRDFAIMAAVIEHESGDASRVPYMLSRFAQELPNLLRILDVAEAQSQNTDLSDYAIGICVALMRFFFLKRMADAGMRVMHRGVRLALRDGRTRTASDLAVQMVSLANRGKMRGAVSAARAAIERIEMENSDAETQGNTALARAVLANLESDPLAVEQSAREAIVRFQTAQASLSEEANSPLSAEDRARRRASLDNDLAAAFGLLADALLEQRNASDARTAYLRSLDLLNGAARGVNDGQILHQIGNCESHLGNHVKAIAHYAEAATRFQAVGMKEYLGNALGELGYSVTFLEEETSLWELPVALLDDGIADITHDAVRTLLSYPPDYTACAAVIRKLFGLIVVISMSGQAEMLPRLCQALREGVLLPAWGTAEPDWPSEDDGPAIEHLEALTELALSVVSFERKISKAAAPEREIADLARACLCQGPWAGLAERSLGWLSLYLWKRWSQPHLSIEALRTAALEAIAAERSSIA